MNISSAINYPCHREPRICAAWRSSRFDKPFDRLRVVSEVEPLKVPSRSRDWIASSLRSSQ